MEALFGRSTDARVDAMRKSLEHMLTRVDAAEKENGEAGKSE